MEEVTRERLLKMLEVAGLTPSQDLIDVMVPQAQQLARALETLRSAGLETEELGGVYKTTWPDA